MSIFDHTPVLLGSDFVPKKVTLEHLEDEIEFGSLITGVHGYLGSGKTLLAYMNTKDYWAKNWNPHANVKLTKIPYKPVNFQELLLKALYGENYEDDPIVWFMDQIEDYMDARSSMAISHRIYSYFIYQVRKRNHRMTYTSTSSFLNDWRLGSETEFSISAQKKHEGELLPNGRHKDLGLCYVPRCKRKHFFRYHVINNIKKRMVKKFEIHNPEPLFEEYDSYELYKPIDAITTGELRKILGAIGISKDEIEEKIYELEQERSHDMVKRPILKNPAKHLPEDLQELLLTESPQNSNSLSEPPIPRKRSIRPANETPISDKGRSKNPDKEMLERWAAENPLPDEDFKDKD